MPCRRPMYLLLSALALGVNGCDRDHPFAADARVPQAVQQSRDATLAPLADTYLRQGNPNQNQGTELILRLQASGKNRALLRWDPQAIAGALGGDSLVAARLELTITHNADNWGATGRTIDLHRLTQAWTETGATWNCADDTDPSNPVADCAGSTAWAMDGPDPRPYDPMPTATRVITNGLRGVVTFDVTADVRALASGGGAQHGWILKKTDEGASGQVEFGSRESESPPTLIVSTVPVEDPSVTQVVPPEGGEVQLPGFATVTFPAGAFAAPQSVTVTATSTALTRQDYARSLGPGEGPP
ncbi:MAG: DNRLRE domain-containing protein, partial [Tepidiformaceae bacterium]